MRCVVQEMEMITQIELQRRAEQLREREKELDCLYALSNLIEQPGISLEGILQGTVRLLPPCLEVSRSHLRADPP